MAFVSVMLELDGELTTTYPLGGRSDAGSSRTPTSTGTSSVSWQVTAQPDGTLIDASGNEYSYLYWEGRQIHSMT